MNWFLIPFFYVIGVAKDFFFYLLSAYFWKWIMRQAPDLTFPPCCLFIYSPHPLRLTTLRMKSGHRIVVTAMSNISFCQFWLLSPPPHLMSLYSPESAVGMKGRGLAADLRGRRVLKDGSEREGEGWREREREGAVFPAESRLSGLAG